MTTIINLFGGPGTGKSTLAAELFVELKRAGKSVELVREYAKDWAWQGHTINSYFDQIYILGKQLRREVILYNKVDYIITDSPIHLGGFYSGKYIPERSLTPVVKNILAEQTTIHIRSYNFFLKRFKKYDPAGRYQNEEEAKAIEEENRTYLINNFEFESILVPDNEKAAEILAKLDLLNLLAKII